ncbi:MAG TPA: long-chain fatty acid--CoA ligase [Myxococcales bacterium]|nr:long-chain fatty acid--CoA ligase [Myxococcales bacterium]
MNGLMMDVPLTLRPLFERAGRLFGSRMIAWRRPDRSVARQTYAQFHARTQQLANALSRLGLSPGDRVATLAWNHGRHLEAYFAVPLSGLVLHTINPRLSPQDLAFIFNDAKDKVLIVDEALLPVLEKFRSQIDLRQVIVWSESGEVPQGMINYECFIGGEPAWFTPGPIAEEQAAGLCYTSGTTGRPKGVLYSHRSLVLHSLVSSMPDMFALGQRDVVMPVVPMFHVNAWGLPYTAVAVGASLVFPGPHLDPVSVLDLAQAERVTFTAGVPTVWNGILEALDREPGRWDLDSLKTLVVGGSAMPQASIEGFRKRHSLEVVHAWGMTELSPLGTVSRLKPHLETAPEGERFRLRATQGLPAPLVEVRSMTEAGEAPADGRSMGELQVRGPWVASAYLNQHEAADKFTADGWFRTGDIVTIDPEGYLRIADRTKDLIKSGGEWISSVDLENALMGHPAIREAAVVAAPHPKWDERPVACVVLRDGAAASEKELRGHLAGQFARFWLPDRFLFLETMPRTTVGKLNKVKLREQVASLSLA